ncbi:hypothetical protein HDE_07774 [Halotydeus destructor]|nr:hypothetical protein HDE_07774 [Halotydeus destructor]
MKAAILVLVFVFLMAPVFSQDIKQFIRGVLSTDKHTNLLTRLARQIRFPGHLATFDLGRNIRGYVNSDETVLTAIDGVTYSQMTLIKGPPRKLTLQADLVDTQLKSSGSIAVSGEKYTYLSTVVIPSIQTLTVLELKNQTKFELESVNSKPIPQSFQVNISSKNPNITIPSYVVEKVRIVITQNIAPLLVGYLDKAWHSYWTT